VPQQGWLFYFDKGSAKTMEKVSAGKIGKYEIIKVLGRGGMGEVLLAQDVDLGRRVAIKRPFKSALEDGLARFQIEAKAATLRHPNIPAVYEMGVQDGLPFIAMEFVEGEALDKIIDSGRQLDLITKLSIIEQVSMALGYAHENGIIHRDIKPANVIVQLDKDKRRLIVAKIIDFGIAKIQDLSGNPGLTQTSAVIGSLHYIAPERFKGGPFDGRVDIFSAGVTLFKLLTGHEPFTGGEATASYKIVNEAHTPLAAYLHDYPPALDEIVAKSLAKNPEDRYSTGEDFADALHEVIEDLKRKRVSELFDDAERLAMESRFTPALELLEEAVQLDPANTQVRKLRKFVREHQERLRRAERLRECTLRADEALLSGNFEEALNQLKDAQNLDPASADIKQKIQAVEDKKRRNEISAKALADAELAKNRGDITAALRIVSRALQEDPGHQKLLALNGVLARQAEIEAKRGRFLEILEIARKELAARNLEAVDQLLGEAESIDPSNLEADKLRREVARAREQGQRREILDQIQTRINEFLRTESYDQAADLLNRAVEKLPNETMLHRLKAEVDAETRKFEARRFVDGAISQARELFSGSPFEALAVVQKALDQMPGEERLISYERALRQQLDTLRVEQVHAGTLLKARELMAAKQYDKAIGVLQSFQIEFGNHTDIDDLLAFAKDELANLQRSVTIDRCTSEGRALIRDGRLEDAIRLLEHGIHETGDPSLSRLLEEIREQQVAFARKIELLQQRVGLLRDRGDLDEATQILREQLAATPGNPALQELLTSLQAEKEQKQVTDKAISAARTAAQKRDFSAGLDSLQAVVHAYGESAELTRATQELEADRAGYAQEVVSQSIEAARAALLNKNPQGALAPLKSATPWLEFADQKKQADWQRIGQSVKKALEQSGSTGSHTVFVDQLSEIEGAKPRRFPVWAIAAAALALVAIIAIVLWKMQPSAPATPTMGQITIVKAPPHALVSIDNAQPPLPVNDNGELTVPVKPGPHQIHASADGYVPWDDKVDVNAGGTFKDEVLMTRALAPGTSGTLIAQGNLPEFKLSVDGKKLGGLHHVGDRIPLEKGQRVVKYSNVDDSDSVEHTLQIAVDQNTPDTFNLKPPAVKPPPGPTTGNLTIQTNPGAQIRFDNQNTYTADARGSFFAQGLTPTPHTVEFSLDKYQPASRTVTIVAGQTQTVSVQLQPNTVAPPTIPPSGTLTVSANSVEQGKSFTLTWQVKNATTVSISNYGEDVGLHGSVPVFPNKTTTYQLIADGTPLPQPAQTVTVTPPVVVVQPSTGGESKKAEPSLPDRPTLEAALNPYLGVFAQASGKSKKDCQGVFNGKYQGRLKDFAGWCDDAKSFEVKEQCSQQVGGSPDAPTLTCTENITIYLKSGDPQHSHPQKTFRFSKNPDGAWQISGW
jgi:serine/threonine-protein kinase